MSERSNPTRLVFATWQGRVCQLGIGMFVRAATP